MSEFDRTCAGCDEKTSGEQDFCHSCYLAIEELRHLFVDQPIPQIVNRLKETRHD